jgi:hypothetical protein
VNDQNGRHARLRDTATGALAALAAVGAIAGAAALAAKPHAKTHGHAAAANCLIKTARAVSGKTHTPQPTSNQPFLTAVLRLVDDGTLTATEGQAVDREIQRGYLDTSTLTGFTPAQLQAVQQALSNAKRALAPAETGAPGAPKSPPSTGTGAPSGGKAPPPAAPGNNSTLK